MSAAQPKGFHVRTTHAGLAGGQRDDLTVVASVTPATVSAVFTRSRFAGPSVKLSKQTAPDRPARGFAVLAGNANVATGEQGMRHAAEIRHAVATAIGAGDEELLIASTGVIGVAYPMTSVRAALGRLSWPFPGADFDAAARAIMTTDTRPKLVRARCGGASLVGIAKGVGMIEPDMATMLAFFCTDAEIDQHRLDGVFRSVVARTFNAVSIDTDTSTSDTAAILANGLAGPVDVGEFERVLHQAALSLVRMIASDGEGASKLIEVVVTGARDDIQAKRVGKAIVNSPLVKAAVHGADPNWGRVAMAIGKCQDDHDIDQEVVRIGFGELEVYPRPPDQTVMHRLVEHLKGNEILITVDLGIGDGRFTVYGCDLTEGYVRINSSYTT